jgi:glycosyltransferase involved in cell wall biosynthesis
MRILLVSALPPPDGGIATWTIKYKDYCDKHGLFLSIVDTALNGNRAERINRGRNLKDEILRTYRIVHDFDNALKCDMPDIVHINSSCSRFGVFRDYLCALMAYKRNIPVIIHCHCNIQDQVLPGLGVRVLKQMLNLASAVLVLNQDSFKYAKELTESKIKIVPNFIEKNSISENHKIIDEIREVLFVGHVQQTKGCKEILAAAKQLPQIHFTLVGPINDDIASMKCPDNVALLGPQEHYTVKTYLEQADVYLFPSYTEGFSLSLIEAMASGLPCIATAVGSNKDMLEDKGGIIIPVKDSNAIVEAIQKINSPNMRKEMSVWNINKVKNSYLLDHVMQQLVDMYKEEVS